MGKIMSVLEKYKLIEKEGEQMPSPAAEEKTFSLDRKATNEETVEKMVEESTEEATIVSEPFPEHFSPIEADLSAPSVSEYTRTLPIDEIYSVYNLDNLTITDTVFVLENFIKALPEELPEYVKKATVNNILVASAMNLDKLLTDGTKRNTSLETFITDYTTQTTDSINTLKQEISKLSAIINDYQQQIKHKEMLLQEQSALVKEEAARLTNIIEFFNS